MNMVNLALVTKTAIKAKARWRLQGKKRKAGLAKTHLKLHSHSEETVIAAEEATAEVEDWMRKHAVMRAACNTWRDKYAQKSEMCDILVDKVGELAEENGKLLVRCQQREGDDTGHAGACVTMNKLRDECDTLRQSADEATHMASDTRDNMQKTIQDYEQRLALLQRESTEALEALKEENDILRTQFDAAEKFWSEHSLELLCPEDQ